MAMERTAQPRRRKAEPRGWWLAAAAFEVLSERQRERWMNKQERIDAQHKRYPPWSNDAERSLLGILIYCERKTWESTVRQLADAMFYDPWHADIYRWLVSVAKENWRWNDQKRFAKELASAARQAALWEGRWVCHIAKMVNGPFSDLKDLPELIKTLRRLMVLRRGIEEAEKSLHKAWKAVDEAEWQ